MATSTQAAAIHAQEDGDILSSETLLWLPRTVVKRHRTKATIIWVILLTAFLCYVAFIVWDTIDARRDPAASFELTKDYYAFPDVVVCLFQDEGCLAPDPGECQVTANFAMLDQYGFLDEELVADNVTEALEEKFSCKALPVSSLTVNQTGIDNGDINALAVRLAMFWLDDPDPVTDPDEEDFSEYNVQFVTVYFEDLDDVVEGFEGRVHAAKLPYDRVVPTNGETMTATTSHVVMDLMAFQGISRSTGRKEETEYTYTQAATSGQANWYWTGDDSEFVVSMLVFDLLIPRFQFTTIEEVDPVDAWAIIGAIGGVWQFVVIAFGLFFVFSEKQPPDKKIRNFRKSVAKPASLVARRLSNASASSSMQDVELDASDEDLPAEWVKRKEKNGSIYYFNTMTGERRNNSPHEAMGAEVTAPPRRALRNLFRPAHQPVLEAGPQTGTDSLPPGWIGKQDANGRTYYVDTVHQTTQWERPVQRQRALDGHGVKVIDAPMRRSSYSSSVDDNSHHSRSSGPDSATQPPALPPRGQPAGPASKAAPLPSSAAKAPLGTVPSYRTVTSMMSDSASSAAGGGGVEDHSDTSLPPGWERRSTPEGKTYYAHATSKRTQWKPPKM